MRSMRQRQVARRARAKSTSRSIARELALHGVERRAASGAGSARPSGRGRAPGPGTPARARSRAACAGERDAHGRAVDGDRAAVAPDDARQDLDERALAGAVRAEQRVHLARLDDEVGRAERDAPGRSSSRRHALRGGSRPWRSGRGCRERPQAPSPACSASTAPCRPKSCCGRVRRPRLDLQPCAVRRRTARRVVRLDLALRARHRPDERGQLDPVRDRLALQQLDRDRRARATDRGRIRHGCGLQLRVLREHLVQELVVVRTDDRDERLARRLERV